MSELAQNQRFGDCFTATCRFAIQQSNKVRAIDDFTDSHINGCYGSRDAATLHGVDTIAGAIHAWGSAVSDTGEVAVQRPHADALTGMLHPSVSASSANDLVGTPWYLRSPYRQLPVPVVSLGSLALLRLCPVPQTYARIMRLARCQE